MTRSPDRVEYVAPPTDDLSLASAEVDPIVGQGGKGLNPGVIVGGFALLAIVLFLWLNAARLERDRSAVAVTAESGRFIAEPPPLQLSAISVATNGPAAFSGLPTQVGMPPAPPPSPVNATVYTTTISPRAPTGTSADVMAQLRAPAVVVDLGVAASPERMQLAQAAAGLPGAGAAASGGAPGAQAGPRLNDSEAFAARVGDESPESARATTLRNLSTLAPQGTIIPGVLETAINSDLPGFTRAVVSRDVLSFDGKSVLIPRGSRLIGQYKSAVALGQSRAFIIWTRVIRPDGVSIQIGSPGTDALGRGGLEGDVDRHFFRRFSGSILLSVLNAGVASVGQTASTQISIGSPGAAAGLASSVVQGEPIAPTIKVAQGEAIRIFVSRDLDFSGVESVK
jgi:type IV secretory pathway VirB10-like protein